MTFSSSLLNVLLKIYDMIYSKWIRERITGNVKHRRESSVTCKVYIECMDACMENKILIGRQQHQQNAIQIDSKRMPHMDKD